MLKEQVELSFPKSDWTTCLFTDASEHSWSGVVTQAPPGDLEKPRAHQQHEPLAFIGSQFKGSELGWSTFEKEAFAIFSTFRRLDYLFFW